ncbi:MAG: Sca4 family protein, partial [Pseudomonadota bacterium]
QKYNLAKEDDLINDLKQFRGYFDITISQMKEKAQRKGLDVDFTQYEDLQKQWHNLCDDALASFDETSGAKMTHQNLQDVVNAMAQMSRGVNREHINSYLKKPEYYSERWQKLIPEKGKNLIDVTANVAFEQDLALQRISAEEIGEYTRVARLRHVIGSMVKDYPDLQKIEDKLSKGHKSKTGRYDIGLSVDQYMELYESCQKIKDGGVNPAEEVASMRRSINKTLPLSRRIKSAFSRKSKKGRIDPDSDISPESLSNEEMGQISEALEEVTSQNKSTHQKMMSEIERAGGVPSRAKDNSAVRREVEKIVKNSDSPSSNPIVQEIEARKQEKATGIKRIEAPKTVVEQSPVQKQLAVVLHDNLEEEQEVSTTLDVVQQISTRDDTSHKKLMSEIREAAGKPKKKPEVKPKTKTHTEPEARDNVVFADGSGSGEHSSSAHSTNVHSSQVNVKVSDAVDPITQAIRDEIITRQQLYLQQELAKEMHGPERENFLDQDLSKFRSFIATEEGKELVESATSKPQVQEQFHTMEKAGYKAVHSQFSDRFHDVDWQAKAGKVRATEVKNGDGEHVCTLSETTFDSQPQNVALSDGTGRVIRSYRQIDFPKELKTGNGPVHFSMAVKDENGKNISEKEAVYFTAHYDESGKLEEVSSPVPVKFMGKDDDAIGYIERNGKVYTLPVTQGKYKEMMKEVAKNNGMNVDVSQTVEKEELASDMVITNSRDVPEKLAQKVKKIGSDLEATKTKTTGHVATPLAKTKNDIGKSNTR